MKRWMWILAGVVVVAAVVGVIAFRSASGPTKVVYKTVTLKRGDLVRTVKASGTVTPIKLVQVGSRVTGQIVKLYVDFNDRVTAGQVIAQLDDTSLKANVAQNQAALAQSEAQVDETAARLRQAEKELKRDRELAAGGAVTASELEASILNRDALAANLKLAKATVEQRRANLESSTTELGYATIRSPVNGVVISRLVDEGQTVAASLNVAPIFEIAEDLSRINVVGSIPESDIGGIKPGQRVTFTVDAYPDEEFTGEVQEIRMSAETVQNVVTYPIIVVADNPNLKLFPGMTANLSVELERKAAALLAPNAALRFTPEGFVAPAGPAGAAPGARGKGGPGRPRRLWVLSQGQPTPVEVTVGITDGSFTEIVSTELTEGQEVVIGVLEGATAAADTTPTNPFLPKFPQGAKRAAGGR